MLLRRMCACFAMHVVRKGVVRDLSHFYGWLLLHVLQRREPAKESKNQTRLDCPMSCRDFHVCTSILPICRNVLKLTLRADSTKLEKFSLGWRIRINNLSNALARDTGSIYLLTSLHGCRDHWLRHVQEAHRQHGERHEEKARIRTNGRFRWWLLKFQTVIHHVLYHYIHLPATF